MDREDLARLCDAALVRSLEEHCPTLCRQVDECLAAGWPPQAVRKFVTRGGTGKVLACAVDAYIQASIAEANDGD